MINIVELPSEIQPLCPGRTRIANDDSFCIHLLICSSIFDSAILCDTQHISAWQDYKKPFIDINKNYFGMPFALEFW
jgi:hypothetical protein